MFIEFQVGNFRSFRDVQKLTMQAAPLRANDGGLEEGNVFQVENQRFLKTKAIYGGNASGKSNLTKALRAFTFMVRHSVRKEELAMEIWNDRFQLLTNWDDQPIFFQYTFMLEDKPFRYGFQILEGRVALEWLFGKEVKKEEEYFMRGPGGLAINEHYFTGAGTYMEQALSGDNEIFRSDALFLTGAALNGNKIAASIRNEIGSLILVDGIYDTDAIQNSMRFLEKGSESQKEAFKQLMNASDTGIEDLKVLEVTKSLEKHISKELRESLAEGDKKNLRTLFSKHSRYDEDGNKVDSIMVPFAVWESEGTAKLFGIGPLVLEALRSGHTMVIDEFDARFHPNLTLKIVQLFHSETTNPHHAQLLFVTHDTGLLRRAQLRRDQICLINKDEYGISTVRTLIEYKGVRKDASYEKEYLQGSYSAVPYLDEIDWVIAQSLDNDGL